MALGRKLPTRIGTLVLLGTLVPTSQYRVGKNYKHTYIAFRVFVYYKWKYTNEYKLQVIQMY